MAEAIGISVGSIAAWTAGLLLLTRAVKKGGMVDLGDRGERVAAGGGEELRGVEASAGGVVSPPVGGRSVSFKNLPL